MEKYDRKPGGSGRGLLVTVVALGLLGWMAGMPEAHQDHKLDTSTDGARDIVILDTPRQTSEFVSGWRPGRALDDVRADVMEDRLKGFFSLFPRRIQPEQRDTLAEMLVREGERAGIDPLYLAAVIRVESAFYNDAISNKGARGLMQVMPATGEEVASRLGIDWTGPEQLHDIETNVRLGVTYLRWLLSLYAGDYKFALTAYNRGPTNVRYIVRRHGHLKSEFTEYFRKIEQAYKRYQRSMARNELAFLQVG